MDLKEFTKVINEHKLGWTAEQIKLVFNRFDDDKSGTITYDEFLFAVRGQLNERRKGLVLLAYQVSSDWFLLNLLRAHEVIFYRD